MTGTGTFVYIYLITVFWHYTAQTFGISLIYCYKRGYIMSNIEKDIFRWFMFSMVGFGRSVRSFCVQRVQPEQFLRCGYSFLGPLADCLLQYFAFSVHHHDGSLCLHAGAQVF